ncbi:MAG: leucine-rich repeat domain-containing protein [Acutalibacteraceae bacterium]
MKQLKKLSAFILVLIMAVSSLPLSSSAAEIIASGNCGVGYWGVGDNYVFGDSVTWTLDSDGVLTVSGNGAIVSDDDIVTPAWYGYRTSIKSVIISEGVTSIGNCAFLGCTSLAKINWNAESVSDFDTYYSRVFYNAGTAGDGIDVIFGDSVKKIPAYAFADCKGLKSVTIGNSVTNIGDYAFFRCSGLTSVIIGSSVTSIGDSAFYECTSLTSITISDSITSIGSRAFVRCVCLAEITIPDSVTSIGGAAFSGCASLKSITIPVRVTSIGAGAFGDCTRLKQINWNAENVRDFYDDEDGGGYGIFGNAGTSGDGIVVVFGDNVKKIPAYAFAGCKGLKSVTIGNSVTSIDESAFIGCTGLIEITIPDSVTSIGGGAFIGCTGLTEITIPDSVTCIGECAFEDCTGLTNVTIGNNVTSIDRATFEGCTGLTNVTIGNSVTNIGNSAFSYSGLISVIIPESVTTMGEYAFSGCYNLTDIYIMNPDCTISDNYNNIPPRAVIHGYHSSTAWKYANILDRNFVFFDAHTLEEEFKLPATCSAYGFRTLSCEYCDYKTNETIEPLGHTDTDGDGLCDICKIGLSGGQTSCDHEYEIDYIAPTCYDSGKIIMTCSLCGKSSQKAIEATGHNYVDFVIEPTCTSDGYTKHYCINCGDEVRDSVVKARGHEMRTMTITPTCTENGCDIEICNNCGYNYETNMVYALGHIDEDNNGECDDCGYKIETQEEPTKVSFFEKLIALLRSFIEMIKSLFK